MRRVSARYLPIVVCFSLPLTACADSILEPELDPARPRTTVQLKPVVGEASGCSDPTWWRDANGQCWPPDPGDEGGDGGSGDSGDGEEGGGGGGEDPDDPADPDPCDTGDPRLDAPDVYGGFEDLWEQSVASGTERGGWIVQAGGSFRLVPFENASYHPCGININESPPAGTVAMVHTHPWPLFEVDPCGFRNTGTPSREDTQALQTFGLNTGYLLDGGGIGKYNPAEFDHAARVGRCGY